jgi:uncharacterized protein YbcI
MENNPPTRGQLERTLSQRIQAFYRHQLGHQPSKVTCLLFGQKVAIIAEGSITNAELLLIQYGKEDLAQQVRRHLNDAIRPKLKDLIEEILNVGVIDLLSDATVQTGLTAIIAILNQTPIIRTSETISKLKKKESALKF